MEAFLPLLCLLLMYPYRSSSLPMCTSLRAPVIAKEALSFCPYKGRVCCDSTKDSQLQMQFQAMNISHPNCASLIKSILCATCDQFSESLFKVESQIRSVPVLCDSRNSRDSSLSKQSATSFCADVWDTCQNVSMKNSPFAPSLQGAAGLPQNTSSKLTALWQSRNDFCTAFGGGQDDNKCFNGRPVELNSTETSVPPKGLCLERLGDKGYINMAAHPDGSDRAFFSDLPGKIWLATIPTHGSGEPLGIDESTPFVDLTDQIKFDTVFGLMGIAFHPKFAENGRFFASFNCDKETSTTCSGRCGCNSDVGCDPSKIDADHPCRYHNVVAEYTVNGTSSEPAKATKGKPTEVRRILTIGLPFTNNHGGQILFGPDDGYLYIMLGDGGGRNGPFGLAQNKKSLLGKIIRVDVDTIPKEADDLNLWGNYSIPRDNPYSEDEELLPEIWALGLRNPWRCSFDSLRPSYFLCTDVGQDRYEEIDVITKGGNYGWSIYEGHLPVDSQQSSKNNISDSTDVIFPAMGYNHYDVNKKEGSAAITGGRFYRSTTDPCMYGSYLYADLYSTALWAAAETPTDSGNFTSTSIPFRCARDSPIECKSAPNTNLAALDYIYSFGEDNKKDVYILASTGVYRVVQPSRCNYSCTKESGTSVQTPTFPPSSSGNHLEFVIYISFILVLVGCML
ncbi:putative quinoprotein glucose dehydrogenase (PQQ, quinone) [Helianthus annuus]|uniref:Putative six-bladed beta-propeller, TolB-like protein n=1 Tax=Helianthus annuus TaxID=4232 RepID=A0A251T263_HELAN|nr:HIPL1 protein [Helianthus annuus]KAF5778097.1 putative quinoprotein glucose dehydrogenase (PQQ, quinone) [Helianthus annuus]KAJ0675118.1 putative quinoprotein glucose dehydrogenase (PQQ, quinone) [Helianthus annuus]